METLQQKLSIQLPSPLQRLSLRWQNAEQYSLFIKRDDLIHPIVSGNKWRKLSSALQQATNCNINRIGSFGGGYSNHIHALAYCCHTLGLQCTAFIRGDYSGNETPMLSDIANWNTRIVYLNKEAYKRRADTAYIEQLTREYSLERMIPEGGSHGDCLTGMHELLTELPQPFDYMVLPVASGGTLAGLATGVSEVNKLLGVAVLKGQGYLENLVDDLIDPLPVATPFTITHDFHCGGYAKSTDALRRFCNEFSNDTGIPVEPVYSGKTLYALKQLIEQGLFPAGSQIVVLHTGGIQADR